MRALQIQGPTRDYWVEIQVTDDPNKLLDQLQVLVGGYIEGLSGEKYTLYCNEEGKLRGLEPTLLWYPDGKAAGVVEFDVIVGDCVLLGAPDGEGEVTGLTNEGLVEFVRDFLPYRTAAQQAEAIRKGVKGA